jgi:hypothetical protein
MPQGGQGRAEADFRRVHPDCRLPPQCAIALHAPFLNANIGAIAADDPMDETVQEKPQNISAAVERPLAKHKKRLKLRGSGPARPLPPPGTPGQPVLPLHEARLQKAYRRKIPQRLRQSQAALPRLPG